MAKIEVKRTVNNGGICTEQGFSLPSADCEKILLP